MKIASFVLSAVTFFAPSSIPSNYNNNINIMVAQALSTPAPRATVAFVGSANQDLTSYTPTLPVLGETVLGDTFATSTGGKGANQARACGSFAPHYCTAQMICRVGEDVFGQEICKTLKAGGVTYDEETSILKDGTASGVAAIVVDQKSGDNMIIVSPGANFKLTPENVDEELKALKPAVVTTQLEIPMESALQAMKSGRKLGAVTILNPAPAPTEEGALNDFWPFVDIFIPNETELRTICGKVGDDSVDETDMAKSLLEKGVGKAVICTLGARGAMIVARGDKEDDDVKVSMVDAPEDLPARNEPIKDTIGAGDAFCGALSCYLSAGISLEEAAGMACGFASMSIRRQGANYPTFDELPETLKINLGAPVSS